MVKHSADWAEAVNDLVALRANVAPASSAETSVFAVNTSESAPLPPASRPLLMQAADLITQAAKDMAGCGDQLRVTRLLLLSRDLEHLARSAAREIDGLHGYDPSPADVAWPTGLTISDTDGSHGR